MRVACYARVSTERQERQGTIASQLDALHRFARDQNHEVVSAYVCVDDGHSGSRLDRPGLDQLRDGAEAGAFEAVLILCPDRLARKYAYQVLILEELERWHVRVIFLEAPPGDDPHARLLVQIQGAIAEYERMKITERYRRGKLFRARQGEVVSGQVPYGYRRIPRRDGVPAHLEIAEPEAQVVRQIFAWHVEERLSIRQITLRLTESAHPSATGRPHWGHSVVGRLLRKEAYIGTLYFNRHEVLDGEAPTAGRRRPPKHRTRRRPTSEWIPISIPPLISEDLFRRSQAIHPDNSRFSPGTTCYADWSAAECVTWGCRAIACVGATGHFITTTIARGTTPCAPDPRPGAVRSAICGLTNSTSWCGPRCGGISSTRP
jgi:site-specific DNA recombinase